MSQEEIDLYIAEWDQASAWCDAYEWLGVVVIFDADEVEGVEEIERQEYEAEMRLP